MLCPSFINYCHKNIFPSQTAGLSPISNYGVPHALLGGCWVKVSKDWFLDGEGDLLITGLHVIMMCVRVLVGAFVFYNDARGPALWEPLCLLSPCRDLSLWPLTFLTAPRPACRLRFNCCVSPVASLWNACKTKEQSPLFKDSGVFVLFFFVFFLFPPKSDLSSSVGICRWSNR